MSDLSVRSDPSTAWWVLWRGLFVFVAALLLVRIARYAVFVDAPSETATPMVLVPTSRPMVRMVAGL